MAYIFSCWVRQGLCRKGCIIILMKEYYLNEGMPSWQANCLQRIFVGSPYLSNVCREVAGISEVISAVNLQLIEMNRVKSSVPRSHFGLRAQVIRLRSKSATTIARSGKACGPPTKLPSIGTNEDQRLCMALKLTIQAFFILQRLLVKAAPQKLLVKP